MEWLLYGMVAVGAIIILVMKFTGAPMPEPQVAAADLDLVREGDRARWRRLKRRDYRSDKRQDDFFRLAAFRKAVAGGAAEAEARERVRREFPFYYLDPAERDAGEYAGDDANLPAVLRARVNGNARAIKQLMADEEGARFRTMNAFIRHAIRRGAI